MAIKEKLDLVRSKLTPEILADVGSALKEIEAEFLDVASSLSAANSEAKTHRLEKKDYKTKWEQTTEELDELKKKSDDSPVKKDFEALKSKYKNLLSLQKKSFENVFPKIQEHANFPKVKSRFILPEKEGKVDLDSLKDDEWEKNMTEFNNLNSIEYFGEISVANVNMDKGTKNISMKEAYEQELNKVKNAVEVEAIYTKYKDKL